MENAKCYAPQILVGTEGLPREQWLEYRRKGIGGSDAAAVLGISPFRTGRDLYYDKLNIVTADDAENWVQLEVGTLLEPLVAKIFAHKTGYKIYRRPFMFRHPQYSIVVPSGVRDIMREGDALSHCVGKSDRYWERIEQQEAYILFLRKTAEIDKPYYTLEVEPNGTIRQKRTYFDRQNDDLKDAEKFLKEWQKVVSERLTESDREKAEKSKVLRLQEFEQLRQDDIRIHTGDLAGQRLVDVLVSDLMETAA